MPNHKNCPHCGGIGFEWGTLQAPLHFKLDRAPAFSIFNSAVRVTATMCMACGAIFLVGDLDKAKQVLQR
jgi:hypothetical protein